MFVHRSVIHSSQKVEAIPVSLGRLVDKQKVVYTDNGLFFSVRKELLSHATTWMNIVDSMLSEINQS